jgi:hypothetical protein
VEHATSACDDEQDGPEQHESFVSRGIAPKADRGANEQGKQDQREERREDERAHLDGGPRFSEHYDEAGDHHCHHQRHADGA